MKSVVSEKGQVTIPKRLRDRLGIRPGEVLDFSEQNGRLVAVKSERQDPVAELYGTLRLDAGTDEWIAQLRGEEPAR